MTGTVRTTAPPPAASPFSPWATRVPEDVALAAAEGDRAAFAELVDRFQGPLHRFLLVQVGDAEEAEDLVQDAFLKAWVNLGRYDPRWRFSTWLFTLARRLAISRLRASRPPAGGGEALALVPVDADPLRAVSGDEERENLWSVAARNLTPEQRSALWLRYVEERGIDELARILNRRPVTVRVLLFRARRLLARFLPVPDAPDPVPATPASLLARRASGGGS